MKYAPITLTLILSVHVMHNAYSADAETSSALRRAGPPVPRLHVSTVKITYPIAEQIVKDAIRTHTIPAIRQRLKDEITAFHEKNRRNADDDKQFHFMFTKTFSASSQDQLSHTVFDLVKKNESQPNFRAETKSVYVAEMGAIIDEPATPKKVDGITYYQWIVGKSGQKEIECTVSIMNSSFLENIIKEVEREV